MLSERVERALDYGLQNQGIEIIVLKIEVMEVSSGKFN